MADRARLQPARLAVTADAFEEPRVQVAQMQRLDQLELQPADRREHVQLQQLLVAFRGALVPTEGRHMVQPTLHELPQGDLLLIEDDALVPATQLLGERLLGLPLGGKPLAPPRRTPASKRSSEVCPSASQRRSLSRIDCDHVQAI